MGFGPDSVSSGVAETSVAFQAGDGIEERRDTRDLSGFL